MKLSVALVAVVLVLGCVEGKGWWMEQPYDNDDFNEGVEYGDSLNLTCTDPRLEDNIYTVKFWVIPDMTIMYPGDYLDFKTLDGQAGWEVHPNGATISLFILTENHFGFYYCLTNVSNEEVMVKRAVNYKGPFFDDLWDDYRMNTIVGLSSAIAFLVIVAGIYAFNIWYEARKGKSAVEPIDDEADEAAQQDAMEGGSDGYNNGDGDAMEMTKEEGIVDQQPHPSVATTQV